MVAAEDDEIIVLHLVLTDEEDDRINVRRRVRDIYCRQVGTELCQ